MEKILTACCPLRLLSFLQDSVDEADDELLFFAGESSDLVEAELQLRGWAGLALFGVRLAAQ